MDCRHLLGVVLRSAKATKNTRAHGNADNWNTILVKAHEYGHNRLITTEVMKLRETAKADPSELSDPGSHLSQIRWRSMMSSATRRRAAASS